MSASLVGSEMCIRDRLQPAPAASASAHGARAARRHAASRVHLRRRAEPVSYTHLTLPTICSV
eukprot:14550272-Alexandrium_andersonii.AAC.1